MKKYRALGMFLIFSFIASSFSLVSQSAQSLPGVNTNPVTNFAKQPPFIILFDTSGSMNEKDKSGAIKIESAKKSMIDMVRNQAPGSDIGVWTYPGTVGTDENGCYPGDWVQGATLRARSDPTDVDASIRMLQAGGDTPTGPALAAVAEELKRSGQTDATIVLVSDGISNCGPPPCDVAKQLINDGFNIQVFPIGYDTDNEPGNDNELTCIANATNGEFHKAENIADLIETMQKYQKASLEVEVDVQQVVIAGSVATFDVTITNPSSTPAKDLRVVLAMAEENSQKLFPRILAPQRSLPILDAESSTTVRWTISSSTLAGTANWQVIVGSADQGAILTNGTIRVTGQDLGLSDAGQILQDVEGTVVVMGDSYSSGEGTSRYYKKPGQPGFLCHRSPLTYGVQIAGTANIEIIACSGAVSYNIYLEAQTDKYQSGSQANILDGIDKPGAVFLTTGGNDIGFKNIIEKCMKTRCMDDIGWVNGIFEDIKGVGGPAGEAYKSILNRLNTEEMVKKRNGKYAPLIVSAYPQVFGSEHQGQCPRNAHFTFTPDEIRLGREIVNRLNTNLRKTVDRLAKEKYPIYFVSNIEDMALPNHALCAEEPFFVELTALGYKGREMSDSNIWAKTGAAQEVMHPNESGYRQWANTLIAWSQSPTVHQYRSPLQPPTTRWTATGSGKPRSPRITVNGQLKPLDPNTGRAPTDPSTEKLSVNSGDTVQINLKDVTPGTTILVTVYSKPQTIGSLQADENGNVNGLVILPDDLPAGTHTLEVVGLSGEELLGVGFAQPLLVRTQVSWLFWIMTGVSGVALLAGICGMLLTRRKLRRYAIVKDPDIDLS